MAMKTKKRHSHKKTYKRYNHKRKFQTKKRCHRGGAPEDSYTYFMDAKHSGGIHIRRNESDPAKMWLIGPSSRMWTFGTLAKGEGMFGKDGRYKPFIDAWKKDAELYTPITLSNFLYPMRDVDSSYGMVITDDQFKRIFIDGDLASPKLVEKYERVKHAEEYDAVPVDSGGPSEKNESFFPFIVPTPPSIEEVEPPSIDAGFNLELEPNHPRPADAVKPALVGASLAEIRNVRRDNEAQFKKLVNFETNLEILGNILVYIFGSGCYNYREFESNLYDSANDRHDPLRLKMFSRTNIKSEYTKFLDGQKSILMMWANKSLECIIPKSNQFLGTTFEIPESHANFKTSFQKLAEKNIRLRVDEEKLRHNHRIQKVEDDGWCFYRAGLVARGTDVSGPNAIRVLREFALAISWIIVNVCPDPPVVLQGLVDMNEPIPNYSVNNSAIDITAMELVKLISVPKLSDIFKPCLYPILIYNIAQIAAMIFGRNIFIFNDQFNCVEQYCGTDSTDPTHQIFMLNDNGNHFDIIQLSDGVGPIVHKSSAGGSSAKRR
jgi:hypothetical protein